MNEILHTPHPLPDLAILDRTVLEVRIASMEELQYFHLKDLTEEQLTSMAVMKESIVAELETRPTVPPSDPTIIEKKAKQLSGNGRKWGKVIANATIAL